MVEVGRRADSDALRAELGLGRQTIVTVHGVDEIRPAVNDLVAGMTFAELHLVNIAVSCNVVLTERVDAFKFTDGGEMALPVMRALDVADGQITAWHDCYDPGSHR